MINVINEKIEEIRSKEQASPEQVLELMNLYEDGKEYENDSLLERIKTKITDILDIKTLLDLDGTVMTSTMLMTLMLCNNVIDSRATSIHEVYDETGESIRFTTMDIVLANGEIINIAIAE